MASDVALRVLRAIAYGEYIAAWAEIPTLIRPYYTLWRDEGEWWWVFHPNTCSDEMLLNRVLGYTQPR